MTDLDALKREAEAYIGMARISTEQVARHVNHVDLLNLIQRLLPALEDARRFAWYVDVTQRTESNAVLDLTMRAVGGDTPTLDEWRTAIDSAMEKANEYIPLTPETEKHDMLKGPCKCGAWHDGTREKADGK